MREAKTPPNLLCAGAANMSGALPGRERQTCTSTVRHVFELIWPQAGIECRSSEAGCRVDLWQAGLHHAVHVPWALVEFDQGLSLVRAVYRAHLPRALLGATAGLSLSL